MRAFRRMSLLIYSLLCQESMASETQELETGAASWVRVLTGSSIAIAVYVNQYLGYSLSDDQLSGGARIDPSYELAALSMEEVIARRTREDLEEFKQE